MKEVVNYYDANGKGCCEKDAVKMHILSFDDEGNYLGSVIAGCNGHDPNESVKKTKKY